MHTTNWEQKCSLRGSRAENSIRKHDFDSFGLHCPLIAFWCVKSILIKLLLLPIWLSAQTTISWNFLCQFQTFFYPKDHALHSHANDILKFWNCTSTHHHFYYDHEHALTQENNRTSGHLASFLTAQLEPGTLWRTVFTVRWLQTLEHGEIMALSSIFTRYSRLPKHIHLTRCV